MLPKGKRFPFFLLLIDDIILEKKEGKYDEAILDAMGLKLEGDIIK